MPNILVLSAGIGTGHVRAAGAIRSALESQSPGCSEHVDVLELVGPIYAGLYRTGYSQLVSAAPALWGRLYEMTDAEPGPMGRRLDALQRAPRRRIAEHIARVDPQLVISTHYLPAEAAVVERRASGRGRAAAVVPTDFHMHRTWWADPEATYFVPTIGAAEELARAGIVDSVVSGIPIDPAFAEPRERLDARRALGLPDRGAIVLAVGGGLGLGPMEELVRGLVADRLPALVAVICGRNEHLRKCLAPLARLHPDRVRVEGHTHRMPEWLAAVDLLVGKPGGLIASECLASGLPMAIVDPIPGQEAANADHLLEIGAAVRIHRIASASAKIAAVLSDESRLRSLRRAARRHGRPGSARDIAEHCLARLFDARAQRRAERETISRQVSARGSR